MGTQEQILEEMRKRQQLEQLRRDQKRHNLTKNIETGSKLVSKLPDAINKTKQTVNYLKGLRSTPSLITPETTTNALSSSLKDTTVVNNIPNSISNTPAVPKTLDINTVNSVDDLMNTANTAKTAQTASNIANTAGNASKIAGAISKAAPVVGAVAGGASAANNFAKGNHVDGALDIAKTGAMFIPGVGWAVAGAIQIGQMIKDAIKKRQQEKIAKSQEQTNKVMQQAEQKKQENISQFDNNALANNTMSNQNMLEGSTTPADILPEQNTQEEQQTPVVEAPNASEGLGQVTGPASSVNQGYVGALPDIPKPKTPEVQPTEEVAQEPSWGQNILDAMSAAQDLGASKDVIDAIPQGLNSGNKDIAALIDKYTINKPTTPEEVELARKGEFNKPEQQVEQQVEEGTVTGAEPTVSKDTIIANMMKNIRGGLNNFAEGYKDNAYTSFSEGDLAQGLTTGAAANAKPKTFLNRVGEAVGTGSRLVANPALQGLVAGTVKGINSGDFGTGLEYGVNWAANKAKSDNYYKHLNPDAKRAPILSNYDADDFKAYADYAYKTARTDAQAPTADWYYKQELNSGRITPEQYNKITTAPDYDPLRRIILNQEKINTKAANDAIRTDAYVKNIENLVSYRNGKLALDKDKFNALKATYGPKIAKDLALVQYYKSNAANKDALTALIQEFEDEGTDTEGTDLTDVILSDITPELAEKIKEWRKNKK